MINEGFAFLASISFIGWVSATVLFIFKSFNEKGEFYPRNAVKFGLIIIFFYALWIIGMLNA